MKNICKQLLTAAFILFCSQQSAAQETKRENEEINKLHHRISLIVSHSHIPAANGLNGEKNVFMTPTLGLNYELWFNKKWAVGIHNDFIMTSFNIEEDNGKPSIKREFPILSAIVGVYKPGKHFSFFAGPGIEFEKNENFKVIKTGIEYGVELPQSFEVGFGFEFDAKINGYSSWLAGIGISKNLHHKK